MKLTKMAGAFALTAAMALTTVPAFAAVGASNEELFTDIGNNTNPVGQQSTEVWAETTNASIMAMVPTRVAIVIPSSGENAIMAPQASAYKITNTGTQNAIRLTSVSSTNGLFNLNGTGDKQLKLQLDAGSWTNIPLNGGTINGTGTNNVTIPANNGNVALRLYGNSVVTGTPLSADNLTAAVMSITYTIGTAA